MAKRTSTDKDQNYNSALSASALSASALSEGAVRETISADSDESAGPSRDENLQDNARDEFEQAQKTTSSTRSSAASFGGLRVASFESRHAIAMRNLLRNYSGVPTVVPSMREVPLEHAALDVFADQLRRGEIEMSVWTTGVGVRLMSENLDRRMPREEWTQLLASRPIVARGAKTVAVLRALQLVPNLIVPPPHTWRQTLQLLDARRAALPLSGHRVALQEPGTPNRVLERALITRGASLLRLAIYSWAMPHDVGALLRAVHDIIEQVFDVVMFSNGTQVWHLFKIAYQNNIEEELKSALKRCVLASIGPSTTAALAEFDLVPHLESPSSQLRDFVAFVATHAPFLAPRLT